MIKIRIDKPEKLSGNILVKYSAFVSFDYNGTIVQYIKNMGTRVYNPENHTWEMPVSNIIGLCNKFENEEIEITGIYQDMETKKLDDIQIPETYKFKTKPFAHQLDGVKFGLANNKFLLCDDQGLGKTKQIIDLAGCLSHIHSINKVLIVCGVNSLKYNWQSEIEIHSNEKGWVLGTRFRKNGKSYEGSSNDKLADLNNLPDCKFIITNIETLRAGATKISKTKYSFPIAEKIRDLCKSGEISMIALDECHKCFDYNTLINTDKGQLKLGDIVTRQIECKVLSFNETTNKLEYKAITNWFENDTSNTQFVELQIEDSGIIRTIKCTYDHQIYTKNRGYVRAIDLTEDDDILVV